MAGVRYLSILDVSAECAAACNRESNPGRQDDGIMLAVDNEHGFVQWPLGQGHPAQRIPQPRDVLKSMWLHIVGLAEAINDTLPRDGCQRFVWPAG